jgi:hypothetical protein
MRLKIRSLGAFIGAVLFCACNPMSWAQQSGPPQRSLQQGDSPTVGTGPSSTAPGQLNYDPPKDGSVTTDDRGVTTTQPKASAPRPHVPVDRGNDSVGADSKR